MKRADLRVESIVDQLSEDDMRTICRWLLDAMDLQERAKLVAAMIKSGYQLPKAERKALH